MFLRYTCGKCLNTAFSSKIHFMAILFCVTLSSIAYCSSEQSFEERILNEEPNFIETGEFDGCVIDAVTGKPIENAVVVYKWDITVALIESISTYGGFYDTTTDKEGKYVIPSQSIKIDNPSFSRLEPEEVIIYKFGYLWYSVEEGKASSFMTYLPELTQEYKKQGNVVKLQPWIDEFSHQEHVSVFKKDWGYLESSLLEKALKQERAIANNPNIPKEEPTQDAEKRGDELQTPSQNINRPGSGMVALGNKRVRSTHPADAQKFRGHGAGIMALRGSRSMREDPQKAEERRIWEIRKNLNKLCSDYKQGNIPEDEYKTQLHEYLEISNCEVLGKTAEALKELNDYSAIPVLIEYLQEHIYSKWDFTRGLSAFRKVSGRIDLPETTYVISERKEIVQDCDQWWQRNKDKSEDQWLHDLIINGKTDYARRKAMSDIRKNKDESALSSVLQCLSNKENSAIYESAISTLSEIGDQTVIPDIKKKLYHENVYVRRQSALALNKLGDKTGIPVMIASLESPSKNTRSVANAVLREITGQDFCDSKSLRQLPMEQQSKVIQNWKQWWKENKDSFEDYPANDISDILQKDDEVLKKLHTEMAIEAQKSSDAPNFNNTIKSPNTCLDQFKTALSNGDIDKAVSFFVPYIRNDYKELFKQLSSEECRTYANGIGPILFDSRSGQRFHYEIITETDEGIFLFPLFFVQLDDGKWMIEKF